MKIIKVSEFFNYLTYYSRIVISKLKRQLEVNIYYHLIDLTIKSYQNKPYISLSPLNK